MKKPSVTQLIGLLDKPGLLNWANKQGLLGIDIAKTRKKSMADGVNLHKQIEMFCKGTGDFENDYDRKRFIAFSNENDIIDMEFPIETDYFFGRADCKLKRDGIVFIADFKKGVSQTAYLEQKLQLAAYGMATGISNFALVNVPDFAFRPVVLDDVSKYQTILMHLSKIWTLKQQLK